MPGPDAPRPLGGTLPREALARAPRVLRTIASGLIALAPAVAAPRIGPSDVGSTWSSTRRRKPPPQMSGHRQRAVGSPSVQQRSTAYHDARTAALVHPHVINTAHILADNVASITPWDPPHAQRVIDRHACAHPSALATAGATPSHPARPPTGPRAPAARASPARVRSRLIRRVPSAGGCRSARLARLTARPTAPGTPILVRRAAAPRATVAHHRPPRRHPVGRK